MSAFKPFEVEVLRLLAHSAISPSELDRLIADGKVVEYEHTGVGYFLTVSHEALPTKRVVCDRPFVVGKAGHVGVGFVLFFENGQLLFECHNWGEHLAVPPNIRELSVQISATDAQQAVPADGSRAAREPRR
jgi:hypothetical protein